MYRGVQGPGMGALGQWAELITGAIQAGSAYLTKDINKDIANAQLELAKINAESSLDRARAAALQSALQAQPAGAGGGIFSGAALGIGAGTLAMLAAGGALAYLLLRGKRRG